MKRILSVSLGIFVLLVAGLLIGPSFVDWNKYKPQIIAQAKSAAGYDVKIDGDISLSLLPSPALKIEGLSVVAPRGKEANLLTMKRADVSVDILPLISGNVSIDTVRLVSPDIKLETLADGTNSWMSDKLLQQKDAAAEGAQPSSASAASASSSNNISLNKLVIEDGRVAYLDDRSGKTQTAEQINLDLKADTLSGPYDAKGSLVYAGKTVSIDARTKEAMAQKKEIPVEISVTLPDAKASAKYSGIVALEPSLEIQGTLDVNADNLASVLALAGGDASPALARKLSFSGLVTANENEFSSQDMAIGFGDAKGQGGISVSNLKVQNPVQFKADMAFDGMLNLDQLAPANTSGKETSVEERVAKGEKLSATQTILPETLALPFPIDGSLKLSADGVQTGGKTLKGLVMQLVKTGASVDITAKALDIPGKTTADLKGALRYGSSSGSGKDGVTYADPSVTFTLTGSSEQLPTLLRSFAPDQDGNPALEIWKTAQFDITGAVSPTTVSVSQSTVKLDQTTMALNASYKPKGANGRPDAMIDLTTDTVDIDYIQSRLNGQKKTAVQKDPAAKTDVKKALEPVRSFEVPLNLTFDISAQKAMFNAQNITGIRIKGRAAGDSLDLENASAQDYMGAAASLKGQVANLKDLSGIDLKFYGKTSDLKALMQSLKVDTAKLPQGISSAEANISAKGKADDLAFDAKILALEGQVEASGTMTGLLDTPAFNDLTIGAKHPNFVKALQIVNPTFSGGPGLERPFDFYAKAVKNGDVYDLTGLKASLGPTALSGDLKINISGAKPSVSGTINAGSIPLDSLLATKTSAATAASSSASGNDAIGGDGHWSRSTIETGWMQTINLDVALSAQSITYGGWNLDKPSTKINLKDGSLLVDNLQAGLFGGQASLTTKVQDPADPKQPLSLVLQTKMANVDLEPLMFALSGSNRMKASGEVSLDINVQSTGLSPHALVSALQGKSTVTGKDVVLKGFDLSQIALAFVDTGKPMDRLSSIMTGATSGGETRFDTVNGVYDISQGIVTISSMALDGAAANIKSTGSANLPLWTIDTVHTITLKQAKDAGTFDVAIKGPLSSPGNTFGKALFNDVLTRRLQQKAVEKLPDVLGKDLSGKLQGLGILPQKQAPAPVVPPSTDPAVPANGAATPPDAAATPAQPAPVESKKDSQKKAIEGVLKGLLQ